MLAAAAFSGLALLVLVGLVVAAIVLSRTAAGRGSLGRAPRPRHLVLRIVCGALGCLILLGVGIGTWQDVQAAGKLSEDATVTLPTQPSPHRISGRPPQSTTARPQRFLTMLVIARNVAGRPVPETIDTATVQWPDGRKASFARTIGNIDLSAEFALQHVGFDRQGKLGIQARYVMKTSSPQGGSGRRSGTTWRPVDDLGVVGHWWGSSDPLSVLPALVPVRHAYLVVLPVAADDPLQQVPLAEAPETLMALGSTALSNELQAPTGGVGQDQPHVVRALTEEPAFIRLGTQIGVTLLLLLGSAVLLSQVFTQRWWAFAGVMTALVLYAAVLDYAAFQTFRSQAQNVEASVPARLDAAQNMTGTFFYRETLRETLQALADDDQTPPLLQARAALYARELRPR